MKGPRRSRELSEMIGQLERQLNLLEEHAGRAFLERRDEYLPEVAGKLRILCVHSKKNQPLLFRIADELGQTPSVVLDGPPIKPPPGQPGPGDRITLDQFFDLHAVTVQTSAGHVSLTKRDLIRGWCEQLGGVHEDWELDEALVNALRTPIFINGVHPSAIELTNLVRVVLHHGRQLVDAGRAMVKENGDGCLGARSSD